MSCLSLGKKLVPARRAWKGLVASIEKKLHKLSRSKPARRTRKRLAATFTAVTGNKNPPSPLKATRVIHRRQPPTASHQQRWMQRSYRPVYVDQLFNEPVPASLEDLGSTTTEPSTSKLGEKSVAASGAGGSGMSSPLVVGPPLPVVKLTTGHSARKVVNAKQRVAESSGTAGVGFGVLPPGVDERAEAFIWKFRAEMRLQRQRSLETYEEMLARGR